MGIFNKIVDYVTGGSAEVNVDISKASVQEPFTAKIAAKISKNTLHVDKVYLLIRCKEGKLNRIVPTDGQPLTDNEKILNEMEDWDEKILFEKEFKVSGSAELKKEKSYNWEVKIDITEHPVTSEKTEDHFVQWEAQAGLDVPGNDPDSGWKEFKV